MSTTPNSRAARAWTPPPDADRGYVKLYVDHVLQADQGADLDFLVGGGGAPSSPRQPLDETPCN